MSKITRREFAARAAGTLVLTVALPLKSFAAEEPTSATIVQDPALAAVEAQLGAPLSEEAKKLTQTALSSNKAASASRFRTKLSDCSEPCFRFVPSEQTQ